MSIPTNCASSPRSSAAATSSGASARHGAHQEPQTYDHDRRAAEVLDRELVAVEILTGQRDRVVPVGGDDLGDRCRRR